MHLLYADESGSSGDAALKHFVLAGISLYERQGWWVAKRLEDLAREVNPADPNSVEFHGSPMYGGKGMWRKIPKDERHRLIREALRVLSYSHKSNRILPAS